jgi:IS1 family transposase
MWTEILNENFGVTHIDGCKIPWSMGDVTEEECREVITCLEERAAWRSYRDQWRSLNEEMKRRENAVERLMEARYDRDEIPL